MPRARYDEPTGLVRRLSFAVVMLLAGGCADPDDPSWGKRIGAAAFDAASHPVTWGGLSAGVAFGVAGIDDDVGNWLADHRPVFQETETAGDASDILRDGLLIGMAATSIFAPSPEPAEDRHAVLRRVVANALAYGGNRVATDQLKDAFGRERPNARDDESLPSGHTSTAFNAAAAIEQNLAMADFGRAAETAVRFGHYGLTGATAWARIEAREHFPSDVLIGAALGNFLARFAFCVVEGPAADMPVAFELEPDAIALRLRRRF